MQVRPMGISIANRPLKGTIHMMPSKSYLHRGVICASLCTQPSRMKGVDSLSQDILATMDVLTRLGLAEFSYENKVLTVLPKGAPWAEEEQLQHREQESVLLYPRESGSTLRFLIPLAAQCAHKAVFVCEGRLAQRMKGTYGDILREQPVVYEEKGNQVSIQGKIHGGIFEMPGDLSSQYLSGLLFLLPLLKEKSEIHITTPLQSRPYVEMTLEMLSRFGVSASFIRENVVVVPAAQRYQAGDVAIEGDFSHGAFYLTAGLLGKEPLRIENLNPNSLQADRAILKALEKMGGHIVQREGGYIAYPSALHGTTIDISMCPDIGPVLAVAAAGAQGTTRLVGAERLKLKESDRLASTCELICSLGGTARADEDSLTVIGSGHLAGGSVKTYHDHRIAMSAAVASVICKQPVELDDGECTKKSCADFFGEWESLGGECRETTAP
mgnify:CR=1 FL=1